MNDLILSRRFGVAPSGNDEGISEFSEMRVGIFLPLLEHWLAQREPDRGFCSFNVAAELSYSIDRETNKNRFWISPMEWLL